MYVRTKTIKGNIYYYLVEGHRVGGKVKQRVIQYLGREGWAGLKPTRFVGLQSAGKADRKATVSRQFKKLTKAAAALDCEVVYSIRADRTDYEGAFAYVNAGRDVYTNRQIRLKKKGKLSVMCHEFGHLVDCELREHGIYFDDELANLTDVGAEINRIAYHKYPDVDFLLNHQSDKTGLAVKNARRFLQEYVNTPDEIFANVFALCLTAPETAERLAPNITRLIMRLAYSQPRIRSVLTKLEVWELKAS